MHLALKPTRYIFVFSVFASLISFASVSSFAQTRTFLRNDDPIRAHLLAMGAPGATVALARDHVLEILQSNNSCSAWFEQADPTAASTFRSLKFLIEQNGPRAVLELRSNSGEVLKHPYSAKVVENGGSNSVVTLNATGAFFVRSTVVLRQTNFGSGFSYPTGTRYLRVGPFVGASPSAQMTVLLHELGHVIGRIPDDSNELSGQSERNTAEVLRFCQSQIDAVAHPER